MGGFTRRSCEAFLKAFVGDGSGAFGAFGSPPTLFLAFSTTDVAVDGTGFTEATGSGYARVAIAASDFAAAVVNASGTTSIETDTLVAFAIATGDWSSGGNMVVLGIFDALTSGNLLWWGPHTVDKAVLAGDTPNVPIGGAVLQMTRTTP